MRNLFFAGNTIRREEFEDYYFTSKITKRENGPIDICQGEIGRQITMYNLDAKNH
jgi:hypothetical protein